tara:strand:- start:1102 stop:1443 length:342 start_codon:yes stop_codon:yes gene_type:complete
MLLTSTLKAQTMNTIAKAHKEMMLMGMVLTLIGSACAATAAMGVINAFHGDTIRALTSLLLPVFLGYWAFVSKRDQGSIDTMVPVYACVWLMGLPLGLAVHMGRTLLMASGLS